MNCVPGSSWECLARDRERRDARLRIEERRADGRPSGRRPEEELEDIGSTPDFASVTLATMVGRPLESVFVRIRARRRLDVVDPRPQRVLARERTPGEEVAARVDGDVVLARREEYAARGSDRVEEVRQLAVDVDRDSCVAEDVVLVERAHEPGVDRLIRAQERGDRRVELRGRLHDDDAGVDRLLRDRRASRSSPCRRR